MAVRVLSTMIDIQSAGSPGGGGGVMSSGWSVIDAADPAGQEGDTEYNDPVFRAPPSLARVAMDRSTRRAAAPGRSDLGTRMVGFTTPRVSAGGQRLLRRRTAAL